MKVAVKNEEPPDATSTSAIPEPGSQHEQEFAATTKVTECSSPALTHTTLDLLSSLMSSSGGKSKPKVTIVKAIPSGRAVSAVAKQHVLRLPSTSLPVIASSSINHGGHGVFGNDSADSAVDVATVDLLESATAAACCQHSPMPDCDLDARAESLAATTLAGAAQSALHEAVEPAAKRARLAAESGASLTGAAVSPDTHLVSTARDSDTVLPRQPSPASDSSDAAVLGETESCVVPGCLSSGADDRLMFVYPAESEHAARRHCWDSVLTAIFPQLSSASTEQQRFICQDHFVPDDFDENGALHDAALPSRFPGGVQVVYRQNSPCSTLPATDAGADNTEHLNTSSVDTSCRLVSCCVPMCDSQPAPESELVSFPALNHKVWTSVMTAAAGCADDSWLPGRRAPQSGRPRDARLCRAHFMANDFNENGSLKYDAIPTVFHGGKKRVILKPVDTRHSDPTRTRKTTCSAELPSSRTRGAIYVNVSSAGLQFITKSGASVPISELSYSELCRISEAIKNKLSSEKSEDETKDLQVCLSQVDSAIEEKEKDVECGTTSSYIINDIASLQPDLSDPEISRVIGLIWSTDKRRRRLERVLTRHFEKSDSYAREADQYISRIGQLKRNIADFENTYVRCFQHEDQQQVMCGIADVQWTPDTINTASDILHQVGELTYESLLQMGMPLPPVDVLQQPADVAYMNDQRLTSPSMVPVKPGDSMPSLDTPGSLLQEQHQPAGGVGASSHEGSSQQLLLTDSVSESEAAVAVQELSGATSLSAVTADDIHNVLMGRGSLRDSRGRLIKVSLASTASATTDAAAAAAATDIDPTTLSSPDNAKTVVMETPDDADGVHYVPD